MQFVLNGRLFETREIQPENTVGQIKELLKQYRVGGKITLTFSDGRSLAPAVFETNQYDAVNFLQYANVLNGSRLDITTKVTYSPETEKLFKQYIARMYQGYQVDPQTRRMIEQYQTQKREEEKNLETVYNIIQRNGPSITIPYSSTNLVSALNYWFDSYVDGDLKELLREQGIVRADNYTEEQKALLKDFAHDGEGGWLSESKLHR